MKKDYKKVLKSYKKLDKRGKVAFKNVMNREMEQEKLETISMRATVANQLMCSITTPEGKSYFNSNWVAKNIMKLTDKEIAANKEENGGVIKFEKKK